MTVYLCTFVMAILTLLFSRRRFPDSSLAAWLVWNLFFFLIVRFVSADRILLFVLPGTLAGCAWLQDWKTRWVSRSWLFALPLFFVPVFHEPLMLTSRFAGMGYSLVALWFVWKGKMGEADLVCMIVMGAALGFERMTIALLAACLAGLFCLLFFRLDDVPFVSLLLAGFFLSLVSGFGLYHRLLLLFAPF